MSSRQEFEIVCLSKESTRSVQMQKDLLHLDFSVFTLTHWEECSWNDGGFPSSTCKKTKLAVSTKENSIHVEQHEVIWNHRRNDNENV